MLVQNYNKIDTSRRKGKKRPGQNH